jgi:hypothetical protein
MLLQRQKLMAVRTVIYKNVKNRSNFCVKGKKITRAVCIIKLELFFCRLCIFLSVNDH